MWKTEKNYLIFQQISVICLKKFPIPTRYFKSDNGYLFYAFDYTRKHIFLLLVSYRTPETDLTGLMSKILNLIIERPGRSKFCQDLGFLRKFEYLILSIIINYCSFNLFTFLILLKLELGPLKTLNRITL